MLDREKADQLSIDKDRIVMTPPTKDAERAQVRRGRRLAKDGRVLTRKIIDARARGEDIKLKRGHNVPIEKGTKVLPEHIVVKLELQDLHS